MLAGIGCCLQLFEPPHVRSVVLVSMYNSLFSRSTAWNLRHINWRSSSIWSGLKHVSLLAYPWPVNWFSATCTWRLRNLLSTTWKQNDCFKDVREATTPPYSENFKETPAYNKSDMSAVIISESNNMIYLPESRLATPQQDWSTASCRIWLADVYQ